MVAQKITFSNVKSEESEISGKGISTTNVIMAKKKPYNKKKTPNKIGATINRKKGPEILFPLM